MIEIGSGTGTLPAPAEVVWESLVEPHKPGSRPWLSFGADEREPEVLEADRPRLVVWSSLWSDRPDDQVHLRLGDDGEGGAVLRFALLTPDDPPDQLVALALRKRLSTLLFADLRYSYGG